MTTVKYTLDEFVHDMEGLVAGQPDSQKIFDIGSAWLERLTRNPQAISEEFRVPAANGSHCRMSSGYPGKRIAAQPWHLPFVPGR